MLRCFILFSILALFISAGKPYDLQVMDGTWKRVGDEFSGMTLSVRCEGFSCTGILTEVPPEPYQWGYRQGHMKWKNIQTINGQFVLEDFAVRDDAYIPVKVQFISKDEVRLWNETYTGFCIGEEQFWQRELEL